MRVLLLSGGISNEHDVSIRSGISIASALKQLGYDFINADPSDKRFDLKKLVKGIDVVFIALHGKNGEDGVIQEQLEKLAVPFVGSNSKASKLCADKWKFKKLLDKNNINNPVGNLVNIHSDYDKLIEKPYVIKPCDEGSSLDTIIVRKPNQKSREQTIDLLNDHEVMLIEELIEGPEITVGIYQNEALPVIEIIPPEGEEFDYENKYNGKTKELIPPVNVSTEIQKQAQEIALRVHQLAGCVDMSRTDFMIDGQNNLYLLETNTIPGLTDQSLLPKMIQYAGYSMPDFVDSLLKSALSRQS